MNSILKDLIDEGHVIVYLDDILIFTNDLELHRQITRHVLQILRQNKLYLKPEKCSFEQMIIEYLSLIIGNGEVCMDPTKVEVVKTWPMPKLKRDVQSFLGFCNFFR